MTNQELQNVAEEAEKLVELLRRAAPDTLIARATALCEKTIALYDKYSIDETNREDFAQLMILTGKFEALCKTTRMSAPSPDPYVAQVAKLARQLLAKHP